MGKANNERPRQTMVARFTSYGTSTINTYAGSSGGATQKTGSMEMATLGMNGMRLNSHTDFPPLPRRAPLFTGPELAPKPREKGSPGMNGRAPSDGVTSPRHSSSSVPDFTSTAAAIAAASTAASRLATSLQPTLSTSDSGNQSQPHPLTVEWLQAQLVAEREKSAWLQKQLERTRRKAGQQTEQPASTEDSGGGSGGGGTQDEQSLETASNADQALQLSIQLRTQTLQLLASFQQQGYEVAAGLDALQDDLDDLEHMEETGTAHLVLPLGSPGHEQIPSHDQGAEGCNGHAVTAGMEKMVVLRARREHVELCFLDLVRTMVNGLETLAVACEAPANAQ